MFCARWISEELISQWKRRELVKSDANKALSNTAHTPQPKDGLGRIASKLARTNLLRSDTPQYARRKSEKDAGTTILLRRSMPPKQLRARKGALPSEKSYPSAEGQELRPSVPYLPPITMRFSDFGTLIETQFGTASPLP